MGIFGNFEGWQGEFLTFKTGIPGGPATDALCIAWEEHKSKGEM